MFGLQLKKLIAKHPKKHAKPAFFEREKRKKEHHST
jgi:hypothetical protein